MKAFNEKLIEDRYELIESLYLDRNKGVYVARQKTDSNLVIIKKSSKTDELLPGISKTINEYNILKSLDHKGIPKVYEVLHDTDSIILVEEYKEGKVLKELIFKGHFPVQDVFEIAIQLADILLHIHQRDVIHKNINPENIIIGSNGDVSMIDFDISSGFSAQSTDLMNIDQIEGSLSYISPEQTGRTAFSVAFSSDFYSLGVVLYELLAGKPPFDSIDPLEVVHFHLSRNPIALRNIIPDLPSGLDQIVNKLMAKNPDDRYQTATGLRADLELVQKHFDSKIPLTDFKAGASDIFRQYKQRQKLYGRENEMEELLGHFRDLNKLKSLLVLVSGYSGVGKSALIRHVKFPIIHQGGTFISGKFDQFKKDIPYSAFIEAIQEFVQNLLTQSEEKITYWNHRITLTLGGNAGLITEVIPQLTKIIGEQEPAVKLQPAEQEARFNMVLLDFIYIFSSSENPLVLFLDDLQWADLSSLGLIKRIIQNPRQDTIMILGAYRDNEVDKGHPLMITLSQIDKSKEQVKSIHLKPLDKETTCRIAADSFAMNPGQANEVGELVFSKTKGNPFFIHNFLKSLYDKKLIKTDANNEWTWNPEDIEGLGYTDNVIDLMTEGLVLLPEETREILKFASVLGNTFSLTDLNSIVEQSPSQILTHLKPAVKEGYVISNYKNFRTLALSSVYNDIEAQQVILNSSANFSFCHDKVQQAAYGLINDSEFAQLHLGIGRLLLQNRNESQLQEGVFELLNLFSHGIHLMDDKLEKLKIANLCLRAGQKAKDSISYGLGVRFLEMGKDLFDLDPWTDNYELTYNTLLELGECEYLRDNATIAETYFKEILAHSKSNFDKLKVYYLHSSLYLKIGDTAKSLQLGLDAMKLYDIRFPRDKNLLKVSALFTLSKYLILFSTKYRNTNRLLNVENCTDEEIIAVNKFLIDLATSAYQQDKNLMMLVVCEIIKSYLKYGFTDASGFGFSGFTTVVLSSLKLQKRGFDLWDLTINLHKKTHSPLIKGRLNYTVICFHNPWRIPFKESYDNMLETIKACVLNGDQIFTGYTVSLLLRTRIFAGENLVDVLESSADHLHLIEAGKGGLDFFQGFYQLAKALNDKTVSGSWNDDSFEGDQMLERLENEGNHTKLAFYHVSKTALLYYLGHYNDALCQSEVTLKYIDNGIGDVTEAWFAFYASLCISANYDTFDRKDKNNYLKAFKKHLSDMELWAKGCPQNFKHHHLLLKAEGYSMKNELDSAFEFYEKAIVSASENECFYAVAIACENAALLCEKNQLARGLNSYVIGAWDAYFQWGAFIKCTQLESKYSDILKTRLDTKLISESNPGNSVKLPAKTSFDISSVIKASQSIASTVKYNDLLKTLMHIIMENAGAEKGCFMLSKEDHLYVEAIGISGREGIEILPSIPLDETDLIPKSFINYCWRSEESMVISNAQKDSLFNSDPYIREHGTLSMMCMPIAAFGKRNGLLYLDNSKLSGVFNKERMSLLQMLSGHIGISIENALLYENLEEKVVERTREIEKTLVELKAAQAQLIHSEKMASLGELIAGIAHEIQNPLNFVNNFSDVNVELIDELKAERSKYKAERKNDQGPQLKGHEESDEDLQDELLNDIQENERKIFHHGQRASSIVKGMLEHSRISDRKKELTDINEMADEYLRLAYHGMRAKDKSFNAGFETDFEETLPKIKVVPQDIGRVILNLINNAFYAVAERSRSTVAEQRAANPFVKKDLSDIQDLTDLDSDPDSYKPTVIVSTKMSPSYTHTSELDGRGGGKGEELVQISIKDNGNGIPAGIKDKIFQPFFTTKPTGKGTGLGLSLSYDIVKAHSGELIVETKEGIGTIFTILLPVQKSKSDEE